MNKKEYLELLIKTFGFVPKKVKPYRTSSGDGQYKIKTGWEVEVSDNNGDFVFEFDTPEGFNDAVREIIQRCINEGAKIILVDDNEVLNFYYNCKVNYTDKGVTPNWKSYELYSFTNKATIETAEDVGKCKVKKLFEDEFGTDLIFIDDIEIDFYQTSDDART